MTTDVSMHRAQYNQAREKLDILETKIRDLFAQIGQKQQTASFYPRDYCDRTFELTIVFDRISVDALRNIVPELENLIKEYDQTRYVEAHALHELNMAQEVIKAAMLDRTPELGSQT